MIAVNTEKSYYFIYIGILFLYKEEEINYLPFPLIKAANDKKMDISYPFYYEEWRKKKNDQKIYIVLWVVKKVSILETITQNQRVQSKATINNIPSFNF